MSLSHRECSLIFAFSHSAKNTSNALLLFAALKFSFIVISSLAVVKSFGDALFVFGSSSSSFSSMITALAAGVVVARRGGSKAGSASASPVPAATKAAL